jgi:alkylhydroperoxidase family enzyme
VNDELLLGLDDIDSNPLLSDKERAALRFAARFKHGEADEDAVFEDLRRHFSDEEIIELGLFCGIVTGVGGFAKLLKVVTWDDVCAIDPNMKRLKRLGEN